MSNLLQASTASGGILERHRGAIDRTSFAECAGVTPGEYLAMLSEGVPPDLVQGIAYRLDLSIDQEHELLIAADIDRAPQRLREHITTITERLTAAEAALARIRAADQDLDRINLELASAAAAAVEHEGDYDGFWNELVRSAGDEQRPLRPDARQSRSHA